MFVNENFEPGKGLTDILGKVYYLLKLDVNYLYEIREGVQFLHESHYLGNFLFFSFHSFRTGNHIVISCI